MKRRVTLTWAGFVLLVAVPAMAAITITSTSTTNMTVATAIVKVEDAGVTGCVTSPGINGTASALLVTSPANGMIDYGTCIVLRNSAASVRVFKVRYISGTNEDRLTDVQIRSSGGTPHMKWTPTLSINETASWQTINAGSTTGINVRVKIGSGPASVISSEIIVAQETLTSVYAAYPLTITFTAT